MRVLVTGGSGFIGSHVVDRLLGAGIEPRIFDLVPAPHHEEVDTVIGDLLDTERLQEALEGCDAVIHLAAAADVDVVARHPSESERTNAHGTLSVLEAARLSGVGRVIYGSTIWVYGPGEGVLDEDSPLVLPGHLYTASKLAGEMYCASYAELYGVPITILRFGIPYGPRARASAVIPIFIRKALAGEALTIAGDGAQTRRFVYVEDLAEGIVRALRPCAANRVYNLASNETVTIRELAETVQDHVGKVEIVHVPGRAGDFCGAEISSSRAEQELGWRPSTRLREGIGRYLAWLTDSTPTEPERVSSRSSSPAALGIPVAALACMVGTLLSYLLAHRMHEFDTAQADAVAVTTLFGILAALTFWQAVGARNLRQGLTTVGWLVIGYMVLVTAPWPNETPPLALPEIQSLIMSTLGTALALAIVVAANRLRETEAPAPDRLT